MKHKLLLVLLLATGMIAFAQVSKIGNAGLVLPTGFNAVKIADGYGKVRHIAVTNQQGIYVKLNKLYNGKGILYFSYNKKTDKYTLANSFGNYTGTGIYIKSNFLYASSDEDIFRYQLNDKGEVMNPTTPDKIVRGLPNKGEHESKSIVLDGNNNLYVNIGAYSNSCQENDRQKGSMGMKPCPVLEDAGGIWQFKASSFNQTQKDGNRYATGLRNVVGLDWNTQTNSLFVMQHGRDELHNLFPALYDDKQSAELPAECMYQLHQGSNCGWPYIYYDQLVNQKIVAPEYGGDGKKSTNEYDNPAVAFPGHLAPNGLLFYNGNQFPSKYKNGAFVAFHGSWNRAPLPQEGYYVVFVPFNNGKPCGKWEVFANGFAGAVKTPHGAAHRPCGLAQDNAGNLYITDDTKGTIYRISYTGQ